MLPESIELIIVTPERQFLRESVVEAVLPGAQGALGILPGHAPLMTELGIGELTYRGAGVNPSGAIASLFLRKPPSAPRRLTSHERKPQKPERKSVCLRATRISIGTALRSPCSAPSSESRWGGSTAVLRSERAEFAKSLQIPLHSASAATKTSVQHPINRRS